MKRILQIVMVVGLLAYSLPSHAQQTATEVEKMHTVLKNLYEEMMPLCKGLMDVGRLIAGFAALFYIASRVWKSIASAEPIDFYPLFRPFVIGFCIMFFPLVLGMINGILDPTVTATSDMVKDADKSIKTMLALKEKALKSTDAYQMFIGEDGEGDRWKYTKYIHGMKDDESLTLTQKLFAPDITFAAAKSMYKIKNSIKQYLSEILMLLYQAAALAINTIRTFQLIVLSILGPLVFGLAVFDGLQQTLSGWLAKYINIFLWLPVCNIFGAVIGRLQVGMLKLDINQINSGTNGGETFFSTTDAAYLIFLIIGIVGYMTVPTVAGFVINAGGGGAMVQKMTSMVSSMATGGASRMASGAGNIAGMPGNVVDGMRDKEIGGGNGGAGLSGAAGRAAGGYMASKLSGNTDEKGGGGGGGKVIGMGPNGRL